ncbi:MAG: type II toxin-antitoxin system VapC family toxin [Candidatus Bathyarchaeia archaeon]
MVFIDSNIWCYYLDARLPEHVHVREQVREIIRDGEVHINTVIAMEVAHYLTRNLEEPEADEKIKSLINLRNMNIIDFNKSLMTLSLEYLTRLARSEGLGGRDSTILASLDAKRLDTLLTHDEALKSLAQRMDVKTLDPIPTEHKNQ